MDERRVEELLGEAADGAPLDESELRALARTAAATPRPPSSRRSFRLRGALALGFAVLLGAGAGAGLSAWRTAEGIAGTTLAGTGLLPADGWTVVQSQGGAGEAAATAVAANVVLDPGDLPGGVPYKTLAALPDRGIVVVATFTTRGQPVGEYLYPARGLPLKLADAEEEVAGSSPRYRLRAAVGAYNVDTTVYFGSRPTAASSAAAQGQLNRLFVAAETITIATRDRVLRKGQTFVQLFGSISSDKADEVVKIEGKECGPHAPSYVAWDLPTATREGGGWSTLAHILTTTSYRATWNGATSPIVTVWARPTVNLRRRGVSRYEVEAGGFANFWRKRVQIQVQNSRVGTWTTLRTVVLADSEGAFSVGAFTLKLPRGKVLRAVLPTAQARPCYLAGFSRTLRT